MSRNIAPLVEGSGSENNTHLRNNSEAADRSRFPRLHPARSTYSKTPVNKQSSLGPVARIRTRMVGARLPTC